MVLNKLIPVIAVVLFGMVPAVASAGLAPLSDDEMQDVSGAGIAVALDDFRFMAAPTSYFEQVGVAPTNACSGSGSSAGNANCWRRGVQQCDKEERPTRRTTGSRYLRDSIKTHNYVW